MAMIINSKRREEPDERYKFESPPTKRDRKSSEENVGEECHFDLGIDFNKAPHQFKFHDNKPLRNERGQLVLQLFNGNTALQGSSSTRLPAALVEREEQWGRIAEEVNERYSGRLSPVSTERVKKIHMYYRKREAKKRSRAMLFDTVESMEDQEASQSTNDKDCSSGDDVNIHEVRVDEVGHDEAENENCDTTESDEGNVVDFSSMSEGLALFLKSLNGTSDRGSVSPSPSSKPGLLDDKKTFYQLRKDRAQMVDGMAKYYLERLCFDGSNANYRFSARSSNVNQERHQMWRHISEKVNNKYAEALGPLTLEQTKKLFSNLKRKTRAKPRTSDGSREGSSHERDFRENDSNSPDDTRAQYSSEGNGKFDDDDLAIVRGAIARDNDLGLEALKSVAALHPDILSSIAPARSPSLMASIKGEPEESIVESGFSSPRHTSNNQLEELLRGLDKTMEIANLKTLLEQKDSEIDLLRKKVEDQAEEYRKRTQAMLDLVRVAVDRKAVEDVNDFLAAS